MRKVYILLFAVFSTTFVLADYMTFLGQNNNPDAPVGAVNVAANWDGGVLPSRSSTGLVVNAGNVWSGSAWQNLAVRQEGGYISSTGLGLRGGSSGSGVITVYELEDSRADYSSYTNIFVNGTLSLWSQFGEEMVLNLLSGHVEATTLGLSAPGNGTVNLRDGILHAGSLVDARGTVNMLSGGTGSLIVDVLDSGVNGALYLNFETGSRSSFTFGEQSGGVSATDIWAWMVQNGQVFVNNGAVTDLRYFIIENEELSSTISLNPEYENSVMFIGQNNNPAAPVGSLILAANWDGGVLPFGSSTGLVVNTANVWSGNVWQNLAVRQEGGYISSTGLGLRGGISGSGVTTVYELEDSRVDYSSYTNIFVNGTLSLWSEFGEEMVLNLLSGHVEATTLGLSAPGNGTVNLRDGIFHAGSLVDARGTVNMLSGGTGSLIVDVLDSGVNGALYLNFEAGSRASFTFGAQSGGESASGIWAWMVQNGQVCIDGIVNTNLTDFYILNDELSSTIQLVGQSYDAWAATYGLVDTNGTAQMAADPDGDSLSNLAEYSLGGNPVDFSDQGFSAIVNLVQVGDTNWLLYVYYERKDKNEVGLSYTPEHNSELSATNWISAGFKFIGSGTYNSKFNAVTNQIKIEEDNHRFLRTKIELN